MIEIYEVGTGVRYFDESVSPKCDTPRRYSRNPSPQAEALNIVRAKLPPNSKRVLGAAWLLAHILSRFYRGDAIIERDGDQYLVQTRECWLSETGLTEKEYRTARETLMDLKLVEFRYRKLKPSHRYQTTLDWYR